MTDSTSTEYIRSLQDQIHYLRRIVRVAGAILSDDDNFETVRARFDGELREQYERARADYLRFTGRSA